MNDVEIFHQELYEEHQEEASFLYEQRARSLHDEELTWLDLEDFDQRFNAHLDGLVGGSLHAEHLCLQAGLGGLSGDLYVALRFLCRGSQVAPLLKFLKEIDVEDGASFQALLDGLTLGMPDAWLSALIRFTQDERPEFAPITLRVLAWRRANEAYAFLSRLAQEAGLLNHMIWAQGRLLSRGWLHEGRRLFNDPNIEIDRSECALVLLQIGDRELLRQLPIDEPWARIPLGLAGSRSQVRALLQTKRVTTSGLLALGFLGDIAAVETLLAYLRNEKAAPTAARALELITGASLYEEVFIPEIVEEDELFEEELEAFRAGEPVKNPNGKPAGEYIVRLSQTEATWRQWWTQNQARFQPDQRYRLGQPYSPAALLETLRAEKSPNLIRMLTHHEFQIRYGFNLPFELQMSIPEQKQVIQGYAAWIEENQNRFSPGAWYFAGEPQTG